MIKKYKSTRSLRIKNNVFFIKNGRIFSSPPESKVVKAEVEEKKDEKRT